MCKGGESTLKLNIVDVREVVINHFAKTDQTSLIKSQVIQEHPKVFCCNDVVFCYENSEIEEQKSKMVDGIWYIEKFAYAETDGEGVIMTAKWNGFEVEVINMNGFENFEKLIDLVLNRENKKQ